MEKDVVYHNKIIIKRLPDNTTRTRCISSDTEDFGLTIDLDFESDNCKKSQEIDPKTRNYAAANKSDYDELSVGCEENETCVNFFVKVEKPAQKLPKPFTGSLGSNKIVKEFLFGGEPYRKKKQGDKDKDTVEKNNKAESEELPLNTCPNCDFEADLTKDLHEHIKGCHRKKNFDCLDCPFTTDDRKALSTHRLDHSLKDFAFKCQICGFGTDKKRRQSLHMQWHLRQKLPKTNQIFQCPSCTFSSSYVRTVAHFRTHGKEHKHLRNIIECPLCGMKTKNSTFGRHSKHHITLKTSNEMEEASKHFRKKKNGQGSGKKIRKDSVEIDDDSDKDKSTGSSDS